MSLNAVLDWTITVVICYWSFMGFVTAVSDWEAGLYADYNRSFSKRQKTFKRLLSGPIVWFSLAFFLLVMQPFYWVVVKPLCWLHDEIMYRLA